MLEVGVDDYEAAQHLLAAVGYEAVSYQESRRAAFVLGAIRLSIVEWPMIPPLLEIEADSMEEEAHRVAGLLGLVVGLDTHGVDPYERHGIDHTAFPSLVLDRASAA